MRDIQFAIPSLGRPTQVREKSLAALTRYSVPMERVTIFVADEKEAGLYRQYNPEINIVIGELGIGNQRTFINNYYEEGTRIVSMDDDVTLIVKDDNKVKEFEGDLLSLVERLFDTCDTHKVRYWGVPETTNGFFMRHQYIIGLRKCAGCFNGEYAKSPETQSRKEHCEDIEKTLLHYRHNGGILRVDDLAPKQRGFAEGGVLQRLGDMETRVEVYRESVRQLAETYPDLISYNPDPKKGKGLLFEKVKTKTTHRGDSLL